MYTDSRVGMNGIIGWLGSEKVADEGKVVERRGCSWETSGRPFLFENSTSVTGRVECVSKEVLRYV